MANLNPKEGQRYASTDEMRSEFGSYRVNNYTDKICDSNEEKPLTPVANDPLSNEAAGESY